MEKLLPMKEVIVTAGFAEVLDVFQITYKKKKVNTAGLRMLEGFFHTKHKK